MEKRVVVTGANRGIGKAIVEAILEADKETFVLLGSRDRGRGEAAREELLEERPSWSGRLEVLEIDVSDGQSVRRAAGEVAGKWNEERPLYGVVNNAGISGRDSPLEKVLEVNTYGPRRVFRAFSVLLQRGDEQPRARVVNMSSAAGPKFVSECRPSYQQLLIDDQVTWAGIEGFLQDCHSAANQAGSFEEAGVGNGSSYGLSKACLNAYTIHCARENPQWLINACTPGFIETDMTRPRAKEKGVAPSEMGMKPPKEGTRSALHLLLGDPGGSGWYFGSDGERSPLDRYRSPGDPPYRGD